MRPVSSHAALHLRRDRRRWDARWLSSRRGEGDAQAGHEGRAGHRAQSTAWATTYLYPCRCARCQHRHAAADWRGRDPPSRGGLAPGEASDGVRQPERYTDAGVGGRTDARRTVAWACTDARGTGAPAGRGHPSPSLDSSAFCAISCSRRGSGVVGRERKSHWIRLGPRCDRRRSFGLFDLRHNRVFIYK